MKKIGEEPRINVNFYIDESLRDFLQELKNDLGLSISQIIEQATIAEFENDYEAFIAMERATETQKENEKEQL